jgi:signal transduction histidine kinase/DNA-binding response OmpR family regulator
MRLMLVEDSPDDAELILRELRRGGFAVEPERVETGAALSRALADGIWDLVIADYNLPQFSGLEALALVRATGLDLPFILVSGAVGEEVAVDAMRAGAHDFVRKDNLRRLAPAAQREIREAQLRGERRADEAARHLLAQAGAILVSSLDYRAMAKAVADLLAEQLGDGCLIAFTSEAQHHDFIVVGGALDEHAVARSEAALLSWIAERAEQGLGSTLDQPPLPSVLGISSCVTVPLQGRGRLLGALLLVARREHAFAESQLALLAELGRRVALAIDNAVTYERAEEAIRIRDEFLSVASHELKTPLTALRLWSDDLERRRRLGRPIDLALVEERLARMTAQIGRLEQLTGDLLDVTRLRAGQIRIEARPVDLVSLVRSAMDRFAEQAARAACALRVSAPGSLVGTWDPSRVEQICENLLSNAVKYGAGKPIDIGVTAIDGVVAVTVRDHGIGISAEDQARIFRRFERAAPRRHFGGLGLGLYIAAQLAAAHGGSISVESQLGNGATFTLRLPREAEPAARADSG